MAQLLHIRSGQCGSSCDDGLRAIVRTISGKELSHVGETHDDGDGGVCRADGRCDFGFGGGLVESRHVVRAAADLHIFFSGLSRQPGGVPGRRVPAGLRWQLQ